METVAATQQPVEEGKQAPHDCFPKDSRLSVRSRSRFHRLLPKVRKWIVILLHSVQFLLIGWLGWNTSPNKTEIGHLGAAAYFWQTLRLDVFCVNPPLTRMITGVPVVMLQPNYNWDNYSARPQNRSEWAIGSAFIAANSPGKIRWCMTLARWTLLPLLLLGGYYGWCLSYETYGGNSGGVFLTLWCFSPSLLAWGATICPDAVAASFGIVAVYTFREWLRKPSWARTTVAGFCLGLLPLAKLTWIIAFGLWPLMWLLWAVPICWTEAEKRLFPLPAFRQLLAVLFLGLYTLNMGYMFDGTCRQLGQYTFVSQMLTDSSSGTAANGNRFAGTWLGHIPIPLPADFVLGIDTQRLDFERGLPSYLRGQWADHGWWYYYLYVAVVKMPLGTWLLVALAAGMSLRQWAVDGGQWLARRRGAVPFSPGENPDNPRLPPPSPSIPLPREEGRICGSWRDEMVVLLPGIVLFIVVSSQTGFSAHSRYIVPTLPFLFIWISKVGRVFERPRGNILARSQVIRSEKREGAMRRRKGTRVGWFFATWRLRVRFLSVRTVQSLVILALTWSVVSSLSIYPHSLSYFNELAAILPTPADSSYPKPVEEKSDDRGPLSRIHYAMSIGPRNGPRHLLDSNIDWGQDLFDLEDWCESHPAAQPLYVAYWGNYPLERSKVKSAGEPPAGPDADYSTSAPEQTGPQPGCYAVSVNELYGRSHRYRYFLYFEPVSMAGYSIYIYHITLGEANRVRQELGLPMLTEENQRNDLQIHDQTK